MYSSIIALYLVQGSLERGRSTEPLKLECLQCIHGVIYKQLACSWLPQSFPLKPVLASSWSVRVKRHPGCRSRPGLGCPSWFIVKNKVMRVDLEKSWVSRNRKEIIKPWQRDLLTIKIISDTNKKISPCFYQKNLYPNHNLHVTSRKTTSVMWPRYHVTSSHVTISVSYFQKRDEALGSVDEKSERLERI